MNRADILAYSCGAYMHVLEDGHYTLSQWADEIAKVYNAEEPHNREVIGALRRTKGSVTIERGAMKMEYEL